MLLKSQMSTVYLKRRVRLFQVVGSQQRINNQQLADQPGQGAGNDEHHTQNWVCRLGQNLVSETIDLRKVKCLIESIEQISVARAGPCVMEMIKLATKFQSPSKISNIIYYLCRRNYKFRHCANLYLQQISEQSKLQKWCNCKQNNCILLSDMFVFGIYFTQQQFVSSILPLIFDFYTHNQDQYQNTQHQKFILNYIIQYFDILTRPQIMLERYRIKFIDICYNFIDKFVKTTLKNAQIFMNQKLHQLRQAYISNNQNQQTHSLTNAQNVYLRSVNEYQKYRKSIIYILKIIQQSLKSISCNCDQFNKLLQMVQNKFEVIIETNQVQSDIKALGQQQKDYDQSFSLSSKDSKSQQHKQKQQESMLLLGICNSCKHYRNSSKFIRDEVYISEFIQQSANKSKADQTYKFIEVIPESVLQQIKNCADIITSNRLCQLFLSEYNKHGNRELLIDTIFKELYERNNISYIVRILFGIYQQQKEQIRDLLKDQLATLKSKTNLRVTRGVFGKFSNVVIQLVKFGLTDCQVYLDELHSQVKLMDKMPCQIQTTWQSTVWINDKGTLKQVKQQFLNITQIINLLQKLGRDAYYSSLNAHIKFNQIISSVYRHMKIKSISYDVQTINRFNGLVSYLQHINTRSQKIMNIISVEELKNSKTFKQIVNTTQRGLRVNGKQQIQRIIDVLINSISSQNYIHSYFYAQLIQKINSKELDDAIVAITMGLIQGQFDAGNFQGAANWCRFLGELHRHAIIKQNQFINYLQTHIIQKYLIINSNATIKLISSALQACKYYMKKTKKVSQIQESLTFLFQIKKWLIFNGGLTNTIVQHQILQIMQYFHPVYKFLTSWENFVFLQQKLYEQRNIEKVFTQFERDSKFQQEQLLIGQKYNDKNQLQFQTQQTTIPLYKQNKLNSKYTQKPGKSNPSPRKLKYAEKSNQFINYNFDDANLCKLQKSQVQTNSSVKQHQKMSQMSSNQWNKQIFLPEKSTQQNVQLSKPKKIKVIGRRKEMKNKIEKIQIAIE